MRPSTRAPLLTPALLLTSALLLLLLSAPPALAQDQSHPPPPKDEPAPAPATDAPASDAPAADTPAADAPPPQAKAPAANSPSPATPQPKAMTLEELQARIEEQKRLIEAQQKRLEDQGKALKTQSDNLDARKKEIDLLKQQIESMTRRLDELQQELPAAESQKALEERLKRVEANSSKVPELPPDVVSAGDFPGSIRIPGTDAAVKFGGRVRVAIVGTLDPLGSVDSFLTNSIPVPPNIPPGEDKQTSINAAASRFNFELRTPTGSGQMRAFLEGDFAGPGNTFRLRHAYGQFHGFLGGQTWSTFSDPVANHEDLDFEGVSSENLVRQPQIRYTWIPRTDLTIAAALETPKVSVTNGSGGNVIPDVVGRIVWRFKGDGHLQGSAVARQIRAAPATAPDDFVSEYGWGLSMSGVAPFHHWNLTDRIIFQVNAGRGIGRYINDLNSLGGQDGVFDPATGDFKVLPALGWYIAYEHMWKRWQAIRDMNLRSSLIYSVVTVNNTSFQAPDSYNQTHRLGLNVIFSPISRIDLGIEYITGSRENKDGSKGDAAQIQVVSIFRF